ncbi:MAG: hypothetical protein ACTSRZ_05005 [Promethearchaeota archaeon]
MDKSEIIKEENNLRYDRILKSIDLLKEEINQNILYEDFPQLFSRQELINLQIAIIKSLVLF